MKQQKKNTRKKKETQKETNETIKINKIEKHFGQNYYVVDGLKNISTTRNTKSLNSNFQNFYITISKT